METQNSKNRDSDYFSCCSQKNSQKIVAVPIFSLTFIVTLVFLVTSAHAGLRVERPTDSLDAGLAGYQTFDGSDTNGATAPGESGKSARIDFFDLMGYIS
jgi:hypothetical protein